MKKALVILVAGLALLGAATPASAQQPLQTGKVTFATDNMTAVQPPRRADTQIDVRGLVGGVFCCGESGFILGAGIGARPFNNRQVEVIGDFSFMRLGGGNGVYISGNGVYHFKTSDPKFSPYAGAGIGIAHLFDDTEARFEILAGMEFNSASKHPVRPEVRFLFTEGDTTTILLVNIGLGKH